MNNEDNQNPLNVPIVSSMLRNFQSIPGQEGSNKDKPLEKKLTKYYSSELSSSPELIKNYNKISEELMIMGFSPNSVLHSFLVYKYKTVEEGIEILSEVRGKMNHNFIESDNELCFICNKPQKSHINSQDFSQEYNPRPSRSIVFNKESRNLIEISEDQSDNTNCCLICYSPLDSNENTFCLRCQHRFCKDCIIEYLKEEIKNSRVLPLKCPMVGCYEEFTEKDVSNLLDESYIYKYKKFLQKERAKENPNLVPCPIVNCEGYADKSKTDAIMVQVEGIPENDSSKRKVKLVCSNGHPFCSLCNQAWHGDAECGTDKEIKDFATYSGFILKKCPNCKVWTEKNEGCNHMTCKICSYNWCWLCEKECEEDHYMKEGTPCYGKQFNHTENSIEERFTRIMLNTHPLVFSTMFFFIITFFVVDLTITRLFNRNNNNNRENNNQNIQPNRDNEEEGLERNSSKCVVLTTLYCLTFCAFCVMLVTNGFLLVTISINSTIFANINRRAPNIGKKLYFFTNLILFAIFTMIGGPILNVVWLVIIDGYIAYKIIRA